MRSFFFFFHLRLLLEQEIFYFFCHEFIEWRRAFKPKTGKASNHKPHIQFSCWAAAYLHLAPGYLQRRPPQKRACVQESWKWQQKTSLHIVRSTFKKHAKRLQDMILNDERRCNFIKANSFHCLPERMLASTVYLAWERKVQLSE
jgi:hypothetical protein